VAFWRRIWGREEESALAVCTALDIGTEFVKALVFEIDVSDHIRRWESLHLGVYLG
jgi:cell division ATPase FtsA